MIIDVFAQHFADVKDLRQTAKVSYPLYDVFFLSICAIITGCEGWEDIENFGKTRLVWLQGGLFKEGLPVHDTIARLISRIYPSALQSSFIRWKQEVLKLCDGEVSQWMASVYAAHTIVMFVNLPFTWSVPLPLLMAYLSDRLRETSN